MNRNTTQKNEIQHKGKGKVLKDKRKKQVFSLLYFIVIHSLVVRWHAIGFGGVPSGLGFFPMFLGDFRVTGGKFGHSGVHVEDNLFPVVRAVWDIIEHSSGSSEGLLAWEVRSEWEWVASWNQSNTGL